jgi:hypothetical protein
MIFGAADLPQFSTMAEILIWATVCLGITAVFGLAGLLLIEEIKAGNGAKLTTKALITTMAIFAISILYSLQQLIEATARFPLS